VPATDGSDLYAHLAASDYVFVGTVVEMKPASERLSQEERDRRWRSGVGAIKSGDVFTISVDEPLCAKTDWGQVQRAPNFIKEVRIFMRYEDLFSNSVHGRNSEGALTPGWKYLLFLKPNPQQREDVDAYELDRDVTYYRAVQGYRGALRLPDGTAEAKNAQRRGAS